MNIKYSIPTNIAQKVVVGTIYENLSKTGAVTSYGIDVQLPELGLRKQVKAREFHNLRHKIEQTLETWSSKYARHQSRMHHEEQEEFVTQMNEELRETFERLSRILTDAFEGDAQVDWESLKRNEPFSLDPQELFSSDEFPYYMDFGKHGAPMQVHTMAYPEAPTRWQARKAVGFMKRLFSPRSVDEWLALRIREYERQVAEIEEIGSQRREKLECAKAEYEAKKSEYEEECRKYNDRIDRIQQRYEEGRSDAIESYINLVFEQAPYSSDLLQNWDCEFHGHNGTLIVDIQIPTLQDTPEVEGFSYIKSRDEIREKKLSEARRRAFYDELVYKIMLRTLHDIFDADRPGFIQAATANGYVDTVDEATGNPTVKVIASISADREQFQAINLANVDPKATFRYLKGVSANKLADMAAVRPIMEMDRNDSRFVDGRDVAAEINDQQNVAAMPWQDFEYLIRELFHAEFSKSGGEVKVTQASADGGVDAIAFDPDPLRGGKIVIQAKRYTNTVGVSAVRDLYGTVLNEGASSGILVTTSDYGRAAYQFAKDKPLKLLNGSNLLHLLEQHGKNARVDLKEAKDAGNR